MLKSGLRRHNEILGFILITAIPSTPHTPSHCPPAHRSHTPHTPQQLTHTIHTTAALTNSSSHTPHTSPAHTHRTHPSLSPHQQLTHTSHTSPAHTHHIHHSRSHQQQFIYTSQPKQITHTTADQTILYLHHSSLHILQLTCTTAFHPRYSSHVLYHSISHTPQWLKHTTYSAATHKPSSSHMYHYYWGGCTAAYIHHYNGMYSSSQTTHTGCSSVHTPLTQGCTAPPPPPSGGYTAVQTGCLQFEVQLQMPELCCRYPATRPNTT